MRFKRQNAVQCAQDAAAARRRATHRRAVPTAATTGNPSSSGSLTSWSCAMAGPAGGPSHWIANNALCGVR